MPYIKQDDREEFDWVVLNLAAKLGAYGVTGNLNYVLFKLFKQLKKLGYLHNYETFSRFLAELDCSAREIYRREIAEYEDKKIEDNGDIE